MLYVWPFIAFFSAPLIIPMGVLFLQNLTSLVSIPLFPRLVRKYFFVSAYVVIALATTLLIIKYNTITHPFTLADNRHYMFYVFRYTILRHPLIRYILAPVYLGCAYLVYLTLSGLAELHPRLRLQGEDSPKTIREKLQKPDIKDDEDGGPTTSFLIILLLTTALSLITAPLVEPRYFIIPWVMWRLNVPPLPTKANLRSRHRGKNNRYTSERFFDFVRYWGWEGHDYRLWLETAWFLLINVATGYIFLYRGFEWPQEPGKLQRFMW
jgi:alpha-1,2-glucosyltransferase